MIGLAPYLCVSVTLLVVGLCCMIARRSSLHVWLGLEFVLSAANINFVAFARFRDDPLDGHVFALCVIVIAAAQVAVALALVVNVARARRT